MNNYKLTQIFIYPVKSLNGISLSESDVEERGLKYDRRWMLVDSQNEFITQRNFPQLTLIDIKLKGDKLILKHRVKTLEPLEISTIDFPAKLIRVKIWNDICEALEYNNEINTWFSRAINFNCKLVYMPVDTERKTNLKYYSQSKNVSFADAFPFLIIGEESLKLLNSKLNEKVSIENFRPNLVFDGGAAHDEDKWKNILIGNLEFVNVKPCSRCVITTINLSTGIKGKEPLKTLAAYRYQNNKVMFGQNLIGLSTGKIKVGDKIFLLN